MDFSHRSLALTHHLSPGPPTLGIQNLPSLVSDVFFLGQKFNSFGLQFLLATCSATLSAPHPKNSNVWWGRKGTTLQASR